MHFSQADISFMLFLSQTELNIRGSLSFFEIEIEILVFLVLNFSFGRGLRLNNFCLAWNFLCFLNKRLEKLLYGTKYLFFSSLIPSKPEKNILSLSQLVLLS